MNMSKNGEMYKDNMHISDNLGNKVLSQINVKSIFDYF